MVYELPKLENVIGDDPFLNKHIRDCQLGSNQLYKCLADTENSIKEIIENGKTYNTKVNCLSENLETAAIVIPNHAAALEKVSFKS